MKTISKETIDKIKKDYTFSKLDEQKLTDLKWTDVCDLYYKADKTVHEELIVFQEAVRFLNHINNDEIKGLLGSMGGVISEANGYIMDYNTSQKERLEVFGAELLREEWDKIRYVTSLVFLQLVTRQQGSSRLDKMLVKVQDARAKNAHV